MFGVRSVRSWSVRTNMSTDTGDDHPPVTTEHHENSWSANLEGPEHADDEELVVEQAIEAVDRTADGYHVNLVTHGDLGHPSEYLFAALADADGEDWCWEYVEQCGCGGHVTRVYVGTSTPPR